MPNGFVIHQLHWITVIDQSAMWSMLLIVINSMTLEGSKIETAIKLPTSQSQDLERIDTIMLP